MTPYSEHPATGDLVTPLPGATWYHRPVPAGTYAVMEVHDYRDQGLDEVILIVAPAEAAAQYAAAGAVLPVDTEPRLSWRDVAWAPA